MIAALTLCVVVIGLPRFLENAQDMIESGQMLTQQKACSWRRTWPGCLIQAAKPQLRELLVAPYNL